jgi:hypothetical protein
MPSSFILGNIVKPTMNKQIQIQEEKTVEKTQHKLSQVFLNATEKQCSGVFCKEHLDGGEKEYCALGLGLLYYGHKF